MNTTIIPVETIAIGVDGLHGHRDAVAEDQPRHGGDGRERLAVPHPVGLEDRA